MTYRTLAGLLAAAVFAAAVLAAAVVAPTTSNADTATVRVIVELTGPPALADDEAAQRSARLEGDQTDVLAQAADRGLDVEVTHTFTAAYNGLAAEVASSDVDQLRDLPGVRAVHTDTTFTTDVDDSVPLVGAPDVWEMSDPDARPVTGTGMVVAVVDTGVDYRHADLGGGFGDGHRVVTGHDFVNDDPDPMDDNGHGTHVAGIVAADGAVRGVAPGAQLAAYKVLNSAGSGQLSDILAGLDAAVHPDNPHRADVVNLSLSGPGDGTDPLSVAANQAAEAGVVVVGSAGNSGPGDQTVRSPAAAEGVLAVGASASGVWVPRARMIEPAEQDLRAVRRDFSADPPDAPARVEVVDIGEGAPGSYDDVDVEGKVVLVDDQATSGTALEKAAYAEERGAVAVLFYVPDTWGPLAAPGDVNADTDAFGIDAFGTDVQDGRLDTILAMQIPGASAATLQAHLADGAVRVELTAADATDQLADFSSRGPTGRFTAKPDLLAPGVEILSTLPEKSHGRASGTSMAAPHVAGAAALVRQLHPAWTSRQVAAALAGSTRRVDDQGPLEQGAGRLDVLAAAQTAVVATSSTLSFGLADMSGDDIDQSVPLTLSNLGDEPVTVSLAVHEQQGLAAAVSVAATSVRLEPGDDATTQVRVQLPTPESDGDVSGWVDADVDADGSTDLSIPFLLSVRHLSLHVTPDPVPADTHTTVYVRSPVEQAATPALVVECPGTDPRRPALEPAGAGVWRAVVPVGEEGLCHASVESSIGETVLTGESAFETAAAPAYNHGASSWQPIGPNAEAGWLALGANRTRMAVVPLESGRIFVTNDRMRSWRELRTMPVAGGKAVGIAVHPDNRDTIYVALNGPQGGDPSYRGRILLTEDGGASWHVLPGPDTTIADLTLDATGRALAVADSNGLRVTTDAGITWTTLPGSWSGLRNVHWIGGDLYAGTNSGLVVVRDAASPEPQPPKVLFEPGVLGWADEVAGDEQTLLVSSWPSPWLYASHDGGVTFEQILQRPGTSFRSVELVGDEIHALQHTQLWIGSDRGKQWEPWGDPMPPAVEFDVTRSAGAHGTVYLASRLAGLYAADEPGEFTRLGIPAVNVHDLAVAQGATGDALVAGTTMDTFRSVLPRRSSIRPADLEWASAGGEGTTEAAQFLATSPGDPSVVYKVRTDFRLTFGIYRSDDGGASWERKASPSEVPTSLLVHPADPDRVYVGYASLTGAGLVVSEDGGDTWRKVDQGRAFQVLAGDPADPDRIWAGDFTGLYLSEDGGLTFEPIADVPVTAIAVDPDDSEHLVVGGRGLFTSRDGGKTVQPAAHVDLDMWVTDILFAPGGDVYAGATAFYDELGVLRGGRGVLRSDDDGDTWTSFSRGLGNPNVTSLALDARGRHLFAGTFGSSVHRITLDGS